MKSWTYGICKSFICGCDCERVI